MMDEAVRIFFLGGEAANKLPPSGGAGKTDNDTFVKPSLLNSLPTADEIRDRIQELYREVNHLKKLLLIVEDRSQA